MTTATVRVTDKFGRYTTVRRQLNILENGAMIIATTRKKELGMIAVDNGVDETFADIEQWAQQFHFKLQPPNGKRQR